MLLHSETGQANLPTLLSPITRFRGTVAVILCSAIIIITNSFEREVNFKQLIYIFPFNLPVIIQFGTLL